MKQNLVLGVEFSEESDTEPVTVAEVKNWIRITVPDEDVLLAELNTTARQQCEHYLNISLIERTVIAILQNELGNIELPFGPVDEIEELTDSTGANIAITDTTFGGQQFKWLRGSSESSGTPRNNFYSPCNTYVTVTYSAGYPDGIPEVFKTAILNQAAWVYTQRGDEKADGLSPETILKLKPYRRVT